MSASRPDEGAYETSDLPPTTPLDLSEARVVFHASHLGEYSQRKFSECVFVDECAHVAGEGEEQVGVGVNKEAVMPVDERDKNIIKEWPLGQVRRWAASPNTFTLVRSPRLSVRRVLLELLDLDVLVGELHVGETVAVLLHVGPSNRGSEEPRTNVSTRPSRPHSAYSRR